MKRIPSLIYSLFLIAIASSLYFKIPGDSSLVNLFYILNIHILLIIGLKGLFGKRMKNAVIQENQITIKEGNKIIEKLDLRRCLKLSKQYNRLIIYYDGFNKHLVYKDFTRDSQLALKAIKKF
jgi:hypothetical protein